MLKLEIMAKDPMDLFEQIGRVCVALAPGLKGVSEADLAQRADPNIIDVEATEVDPKDPKSETETTQRRKPGRPPKSAAAAETEQSQDDLLGDDKSAKPPKELTMDDMRQRVKEIIDAHAARGNERNACVDYVRHLFNGFRIGDGENNVMRPIQKVAELPASDFARFWSESQGYLDGTVKLKK